MHFDNTWNTTIATTNIHTMLEKLDIDLFTHVVDNEEYDDILRAFLKAGVIDIETPTDIGLAATLYMAAANTASSTSSKAIHFALKAWLRWVGFTSMANTSKAL